MKKSSFEVDEMDINFSHYLTNLIPENKAWIQTLEAQANRENVPIMDQLSIKFLCQIVRMMQPSHILEIGTGIGYSALRMLDAYPKTTIVSVERDKNRFSQAKDIIKTHQKQNNIKVIHGEALEVLQQLNDENYSFDFIFIDAAKAHYKSFFQRADKLLTNQGVIASDNVLFRGYVKEPEQAPRRLKNIAKKMAQFNEWLMNHSSYTTSIVPIGDGIAISFKN